MDCESKSKYGYDEKQELLQANRKENLLREIALENISQSGLLDDICEEDQRWAAGTYKECNKRGAYVSDFTPKKMGVQKLRGVVTTEGECGAKDVHSLIQFHRADELDEGLIKESQGIFEVDADDACIPCNESKLKGTVETVVTKKREVVKPRVRSGGKKKSALVKFDEVVTKELLTRRLAEGSEATSRWKCFSTPPCSKNEMLAYDIKVSKSTLQILNKDLMDKDPNKAQECQLMKAIDCLAQAESICRFEAAVRATEAATAGLPPDMAEEVAMECAKDYHVQMIDCLTEEMHMDNMRKPVEVITYMGVTRQGERGGDTEWKSKSPCKNPCKK